MTDIVERLRDNHTVKAYVQPTFRHCGNYTEGRALLNAAADEIERLRAVSQPATARIDDHMVRARHLVENHIEAYGMVPHPDRLKEAIAEQSQKSFNLGFRAAGGSTAALSSAQ